jgi:signal transduction histidine kinase
MPSNTRREPQEATGTEAHPRRVLTLVADGGDHRLLGGWLQASDRYTHVTDDGDRQTGRFDCCIVDVNGLLERGDVLAERGADDAGERPVLLLVPEARVEDVQRHLSEQYPERWALVDGVLRTPLSKLELETRLGTLCRLQHQAAALHRQRDQLQQRGEQLALLNRVLRHDVRNDMNVVQGWTDALADHVDEEGEPLLDHVRQAAAHVVELTTVAREFADTIDAADDPDLEPVALAAVLTEEVARRRQTFADATIELDEPPAVTVAANELLAAVFRNLINNAVQHNDTDDPTVTITAEDHGESVVVRVADDGPGVPDEHKADLFSADVKGLESDGTGMGLYLVERLVDIYGGDVRVEDNTPRGAVFVVELPTTAAATTAAEGR